MSRLIKKDDGIYLEDSEVDEMQNLCNLRALYESEERAATAEAQMRAAQELAKKAEQDREIAISSAIQVQQKAARERDDANFRIFVAEQKSKRIMEMRDREKSNAIQIEAALAHGLFAAQSKNKK